MNAIYNKFRASLTKPVNRLEAVLISVILVPILAATVTSAATTISTDISTGGNLSVTATSTLSGATWIGTTTPALYVDPGRNKVIIGTSTQTVSSNKNGVLEINQMASSGDMSGLQITVSRNDSGFAGTQIRPVKLEFLAGLGGYSYGGTSLFDTITQISSGKYAPYVNAYNAQLTSSGTIGEYVGLNLANSLYSGSTVTDYYGVRVENLNLNGGVATNAYGLYVGNFASGATSYSLYVAGPTKSYFGGNVGIGTTTPSTQLHVANSNTNATTSITIGKTGQTKGSCLEMYDATGAVKYVSIVGSAFVISATSCK